MAAGCIVLCQLVAQTQTLATSTLKGVVTEPDGAVVFNVKLKCSRYFKPLP